MAGKSKNYYVTVSEIVSVTVDGVTKTKHRTVLSKQLFDVGAANAFKKEMETKYPAPGYLVIREYY